jgi:hypothetical protein
MIGLLVSDNVLEEKKIAVKKKEDRLTKNKMATISARIVA